MEMPSHSNVIFAMLGSLASGLWICTWRNTRSRVLGNFYHGKEIHSRSEDRKKIEIATRTSCSLISTLPLPNLFVYKRPTHQILRCLIPFQAVSHWKNCSSPPHQTTTTHKLSSLFFTFSNQVDLSIKGRWSTRAKKPHRNTKTDSIRRKTSNYWSHSWIWNLYQFSQ